MARKQTRTAPKRNKIRALSSPGSFGPVSQINTAPVSVGNSIRGSKPRISQTTNGARIVGRDFAFALSATTALVTGFEIIGGMPLTPCALPSSILRNYCQMFQKFKINKVVAHYITSSPTSQAGDVLFYYERDALSPMVDYSSSNFLPYVLSDSNTVIGPQWTNHSMLINPVSDWKSTLYGNQTDLNEDKAGSLFFFSKTNAANSPGYLLIDYDISFKELSVNPRAGTLPIARAQSTFVCFNKTAAVVVGGTTFSFTDITTGKTISGASSVAPTGVTPGDVYKVRLQVTASQQANAAWININATNMLRFGDNTAINPIDDGITLYILYDGTTYTFFATLEQAVTGTVPLEFNNAATVTFNLCCELQFVRNNDLLTQSSY